jgi:type II secretory pathway pseudopilin PulG
MRRQHEVERMQRENEQLQQRLRQAEAKLQQYMHQQQTHKSSISSSSSSSSHPTLPAGRRLFGRDEEEEEEKRDEEEDEDVQKEIEEPPSSDGEDDPYKSYNAWLEKRQEMYPFDEEHYKKYYRHRHTLLNHDGRVMEYWRFGLLTGFPARLYASPWQRYEEQIQREVGYRTERRLWRSVSMDQLNRSVPEFLFDKRDKIRQQDITSTNNGINDVPSPGSFVLRDLPLELQQEPPPIPGEAPQTVKEVIKKEVARRRFMMAGRPSYLDAAAKVSKRAALGGDSDSSDSEVDAEVLLARAKRSTPVTRNRLPS